MIRRAQMVLAVMLCGTLLHGCYLSHGRAPRIDGGRRDAGSIDSGTVDAGTLDAGAVDAGIDRVCIGIRVAESVAIEDGSADSVTPRLVALPGNEVGLVHVRTDGSPSRIRYERLSARLDRLVSTDATLRSWTWAEPAFRDGTPWIAYGGVGDRMTTLQALSLDGEAIGPAYAVPVFHPTIFRSTRDGFFWLTRVDDHLVMTHIAPDGAPFYPPVDIPLGRYGSGHGALARPDGRSFVVTYPREGPPGVRNTYVNAITDDGRLGPELPLAEDGDGLAIPVRQGSSFLVVSHGDALVIDRREFETLDSIERFLFPPLEGRPFFVGVLRDRVIVGHIAEGRLRVDDFGSDMDPPTRLEVASPGRAVGPSGSVLETVDSLYIAIYVNDGGTTYPFVTRFVCVYE